MKFISRVEQDISHSFALLTCEIPCSTPKINFIFHLTSKYIFFYLYNLNIKAAAGKVKGINKQTDRQTDK